MLPAVVPMAILVKELPLVLVVAATAGAARRQITVALVVSPSLAHVTPSQALLRLQ